MGRRQYWIIIVGGRQYWINIVGRREYLISIVGRSSRMYESQRVYTTHLRINHRDTSEVQKIKTTKRKEHRNQY